jgi:hypothetical protein
VAEPLCQDQEEEGAIAVTGIPFYKRENSVRDFSTQWYQMEERFKTSSTAFVTDLTDWKE